jgi:7tm Odorant receptor.
VLPFVPASPKTAYTFLQSENVYQAAYDSGWQNHSKGLKQLIGMMIMGAQRPVAVQAGFFGELSLPMYNSVSQCRHIND